MDGSVYDVFISFRGKDTRSGFTGNLHRTLCVKQIKSFMDDHDLVKGAKINPALDNAIQTSRIALVILSKNYASSTFCLDELEKIMNCSQHKRMLVLPVFFKVDPSDVRYQKGKYAGSLKKHEDRIIHEKEKIKEWRFALTEVSHHSGWNLKDYRYEYELIDIIVEDIIKKIHRLRDAEKEKHVTKPKNIEINDMSISGVLKYDSRKMIAAAVLIQRKFRRWRLYRERQAIKIQAAFRGYQVRKQYRKMIWFGAVGKAILHWRLTTRGLCVLKHGNETEEKLLTRRFCIVDEKHVTKPNTVEILVTDPTPQKSLIEEINDISIYGVLNYDSRKMIAAAVLIQRKYLTWRLYREHQAIKIQAAFREYQVRKQYRRKMTRRFYVLRHGNETEEDLFLEGMKEAKKHVERYEASVKAREAGSSRSSLRPRVPQVASASLCFKAGLDHLQLNHLSEDALSCFDESFPLLA